MLSAWANDIIGWIPYVGDDCDVNPDTCGSFAVYKIAFPLTLFHLILALLLIGVKTTRDSRARIQTAWWPLKIPLLLLMILASFFIPDSFFTGYGESFLLLSPLSSSLPFPLFPFLLFSSLLFSSLLFSSLLFSSLLFSSLLDLLFSSLLFSSRCSVLKIRGLTREEWDEWDEWDEWGEWG